MLTTDLRGRWAEEQAKHLLERKGYHIILRRFKCRYGEIDLIAQQDDYLVAVEVKYRQYFSDAANSVSLAQRKRIIMTLCHFLAEQNANNAKYSFLRFDVVLLCQAHDPIHIVNAWQNQDESYEF